MTTLRLGDHGPAVAEVRSRLEQLGLLESGVIDDSGFDDSGFDEALDAAVRSFQQERGITIDGIVGPETFRRLDEARWQLGDRVLSFTPGHLVCGDDVTELQRRLNQLGFATGRPDGRFGSRTDAALREFQRGVGVNPDGTCGPDTFRAFDRLVRAISGGNATALREQAAVFDLQTGIRDKVVVLDPGDLLDTFDSGLNGTDPCHAVAVRIEGRLAALGTQVVLTRGPRTTPRDDVSRAEFANEVDADLVVSLHVDWCASPQANGVATFYFGDSRGGVHSPAGRELAEVLHAEIIGRTDLLDCRTQARSWDLLRLTRMPAVRIELGYVSNEDDRRRLLNSAFQEAVAEAIAAGLAEFCSPVPHR